MAARKSTEPAAVRLARLQKELAEKERKRLEKNARSREHARAEVEAHRRYREARDRRAQSLCPAGFTVLDPSHFCYPEEDREALRAAIRLHGERYEVKVLRDPESRTGPERKRYFVYGRPHGPDSKTLYRPCRGCGGLGCVQAADHVAANVYADWLEDNGEPRAAEKLRRAFPLGE